MSKCNIELYDVSSGTHINLTHDFNSVTFDSQMFIQGSVTNQLDVSAEPKSFSVNQIYPNPFNPATQININVMQSGLYEFRVYNLRGQMVHDTQLVYDKPGEYTINWNGAHCISGTYIATISNGTQVVSKKLTLMK